ncbi:MAG: hypothetical protein ABSB30_05860 [Terracidiphilus sp.]|jgi:hypothetical protein
MQMIQCPNCGKLTGFKRNLGFGTIIMIVLTAGFWIFILPFYPLRCIVCGLNRGSIPTKSSRLNALFPLIVVVVIIAIAVLSHTPETGTTTHDVAQSSATVTGSDSSYSASNVISTDNPSPDVPVNFSEQVIHIDGAQLHHEYEEDDRAADVRYKNRRVLVTGSVTGLAIPSMEEGMKIARKGLEANAVLMMDSPPVPDFDFRSGAAMFYPGISAHFKNGSFFGTVDQAEINRSITRNGEATLLCKVGDYYRISELTGGPRSMFGDVNIGLYDCVFQEPLQEQQANPPASNNNSAPPADPTAGVSKGQTPSKVLARLGPPVSVTLGAKHVYSYPHLKIIFVDGRVSDVQRF